jgi:TfoX/Sxy family transcriptional regulator of competence genes
MIETRSMSSTGSPVVSVKRGGPVSTSKELVQEIVDRLAPLSVRSRAMFGEYGLYCDEKIVALICNDTLFIKPSDVSSEFFSDASLAPPYQGAKDYYAVSTEWMDDDAWLRKVVQETADALPAPKPKKRSRS